MQNLLQWFLHLESKSHDFQLWKYLAFKKKKKKVEVVKDLWRVSMFLQLDFF